MGELSYILPEFEASAPPLDEAFSSDSLIAGFLRSAREHLRLEIGFIARWIDGEEREITHVDTTLDLPLGPGFRQHRDETYCWHVLNGRLPEMIADSADYEQAQQLHITSALPVGCHFSVPIRFSDGTVWGSFCVLGRNPDSTMNPRDLAILDSFASMATDRIEELVCADSRQQAARSRVTDMFDGDAVTIYQQPIHVIETSEPAGVECLARFPDVNKRGPGAWFEDAEALGLGEELEMTAVRGALETLGNVPDGFFASVKAPARAVASGAVRKALDACDTGNIVITLTQYQRHDNLDALVTQAEAFRPETKIAVDAVGGDLASLRLVEAIKPDFIKLDMALTRGIAKSSASRAMVSAVVELARTYGATVIAEGIEEASEAATMQGLGVTLGQGYLFARPLPLVAAAQHLNGISA